MKMLKKLIKYELKSMAGKFLALYSLLILSSIFLSIQLGNKFLHFRFIPGMIFYVTLLSTIAGLFIITIKRYKKSVFGDEAYLTFTLPTSINKILISKAFTMTIYFFMTSIVVIIATSIANSYLDLSRMQELYNELFKNMTFMKVIKLINMIIAIFLTWLIPIMIAYLSISIGQISKIRRGKNICSIAFFFVTYYIYNNIVQVIGRSYDDTDFSLFGSIWNAFAIFFSVFTNIGSIDLVDVTSTNSSLFISNLIGVIFVIVCHRANVYILNNKLNLY